MKIKNVMYGAVGVVALVASLSTASMAVATDEMRGGDMMKRGEMMQRDQVRAIGSTLEVHFLDNGKVLVRGAKVTGVNGTTVNAVTAWGSVVLNWAIMTDGNTEIIRRYGGKSVISEISVGDFVSFQGSLDTTVSASYTVHATVLKDWSIQKRSATFYGTVKTVNSSTGSLMTFVLATEERGDQTIMVTSSTKIMKGIVPGVFADIVVGAKITTRGLWDNVANTLQADEIKIHSPGVVRTTIEGTIKSIAGTTAPTTMILTAGGKDYTVKIDANTSLLNTLWLRTTLETFHVGDKIRVYGAVNTDATVDATILRNTSRK